MAGLDDLLGEANELEQPKLNESVGPTPNAELMAEARLALSGNWGMGILGYILYTFLILSFLLLAATSVLFVVVVSAWSESNVLAAYGSVFSAAALSITIVSGPFAVGLFSFYLVIAQEGQARLESLFTGFRRFWKSFGVYFLYSLFVLLWMLLLIIPGIIASFSYAMAFFIVADDETCGPLEALGRSKEMMKGNKWKYFCLHWRFIGWSLLAAFTFGIGFLWLIPYMQTAQAKFYEDVK